MGMTKVRMLLLTQHPWSLLKRVARCLEVEGFLNLLVSHILENYPTAPEAMPHIQKLISVVKSSPRPIYLKCRMCVHFLRAFICLTIH